jgi:AcrR family transcriptional regulator
MAGRVKPPVASRRAYSSSRREEQARRTRRAVIDAARVMFLDHGYPQTTIAAVASAAQVSVETVYKAFGNKPALAKAVFDVSIVGDDEPVPMMQREHAMRNMAEPDPRVKLTTYGHHVASVAGRTGALLLVLRAAAAGDAGAADVWTQLQDERLTGMGQIARNLDEAGHLRNGVTRSEARDVLWTHNSVEMWDLLVNQRGWALERFGQWTVQQLIAALL